MATGKMHADELEIDTPLVRRLLADQFPELAGLPVEPVASPGAGSPWSRSVVPRLEGGCDVGRESRLGALADA